MFRASTRPSHRAPEGPGFIGSITSACTAFNPRAFAAAVVLLLTFISLHHGYLHTSVSLPHLTNELRHDLRLKAHKFSRRIDAYKADDIDRAIGGRKGYEFEGVGEQDSIHPQLKQSGKAGTPSNFPTPIAPRPERAHYNTVEGVVFYGRPNRVRILNCYLERNLVPNGGLLSAVKFVVATFSTEDLAFLDRLIATHPKEYFKVWPDRSIDVGYTGHYAWMNPNTLYLKIDDDVVYIHDNAIDLMMNAHLTNQWFLVSGNVINHQPLEASHARTGATYNFTQRDKKDPTSWEMHPE